MFQKDTSPPASPDRWTLVRDAAVLQFAQIDLWREHHCVADVLDLGLVDDR